MHVNCQLLHKLETKNSLTPFLRRLYLYFQQSVTNFFQKKLHLLAIFLDLTKAFNMTWKHSVLTTLHEWNFRGNIPPFIQNIPSTRSFHARIGHFISDDNILIKGVPQIFILSLIFCNIAINIFIHIYNPVYCLMLVDDLLIYVSCSDISLLDTQ